MYFLLFSIPALLDFRQHSRLQFLCWDPCMKKSLAIPAAEMPYHIAEYDTQWVLLAVDKFMEEAAPYVRCLVCDSHGSHLLLRRLFFGTMTPDDKIVVDKLNLNWLSKVKHEALPEHSLPRLPVRIASVNGEVYNLLGGPCVPVRSWWDVWNIERFLLYSTIVAKLKSHNFHLFLSVRNQRFVSSLPLFVFFNLFFNLLES